MPQPFRFEFGLLPDELPLDRSVPGLGIGMPEPAARGAAQSSVGERIRQIESGGRNDAKNPNSSATGPDQFIEGTWLDMLRRHRPDILQGRSRAEVLELRKDPALSGEMRDRLAQENAAYLQARGLPTTPDTAYLAHFLGPQGAAALLRAPPGTPVEQLLERRAIEANRSVLAGKTSDQVIAWAGRKMAGAGGGGSASASQARQPSVEERFAALEKAEPGRYRIIPADEYEDWAAQWRRDNPPPGLLRRIGSGAREGWDLGQQGVSLTGRVLGGADDTGLAGSIAEHNRRPSRTSADMQAIQERLEQVAEPYEGAWGRGEHLQALKGVFHTILSGAGEFARDPASFAEFTAQALGTSAVPIASMVVGGIAGSAMAPGAGTLAGTIGGGFIGSAGLEFGLWMQEKVTDEVKKAGGDPGDPQAVARLIADPKVKAEIMQEAATKGLTHAAIGAVMDRVSAGLLRMQPATRGGRIGRNVAAGAVQVASEGLEEAGAQVAATGDFDVADVALETLGGLGASTTQTAILAGAARATQGLRSDPAADSPSPAAPSPPPAPPEPAGPLTRALGGAAAAAPEPAAPVALPPDAPPPGAWVRVTIPGAEPIAGTVESYADGEAVVMDAATGEVLQVPLANLSPATPVETAPATLPERDTPTAEMEQLAGEAEPIPAETRTELPPPAETQPAQARDLGLPEPGQRAIVDAEGVERFAGTVVDYPEGTTEAVVRRDDGVELQVPAEALKVSRLTTQQVAAQELERKPPVARERIVGTDPNAREVNKRQVVLPDDRHARLYDLGKMRRETAGLLRTGKLRMDEVNPTEQRRLAKEFGVSEQALGQIADDYRYRVEKAARDATTQTPIRFHPVNPKLLKRKQADSAREAKKIASLSTPELESRPESESPDAAPQSAKLQARNEGYSRALRVGEDEAALPKSELQGLSDVRGGRDSRTPDVGDGLPRVLSGGGAAAGGDLLAGSDRRTPRLPARQRALGDQRGSSAQSTAVREASRHNDRSGSGKSRGRQRNNGLLPLSEGRTVGTGARPTEASVGGATAPPARRKRDGLSKGLGASDGTKADNNQRETKARLERRSGDPHTGQASPETIKSESSKAPETGPSDSGATPDTSRQGARIEIVPASGDRSIVRPAGMEAAEGQPVGITFSEDAEAIYIGSTFLPPAARGQGLGLEMYRTLADRAAAAGKTLYGDTALSDDARAVYRRLAAAGYDVEYGGEGEAFSVRVNPPAGATPAAPAASGERLGSRSMAAVRKDRASEPETTSEPVEKIDTPAPGAAAPSAAEWGAANRLVTRDRADEVRKRLKEKLKGQLRSGIDPEILALGAELAAFHIEAGARKFGDFAQAVAADLGTSVDKIRPYLRAWYNGARDLMEDSGLDVTGTDNADQVRAELAKLQDPATPAKEPANEPAELDQPGPRALGGVPSGEVRQPAGGGDAAARAEGSGRADAPGDDGARRAGVPEPRSVGDGAGEVPVPAGRDGRGRVRLQRSADHATDAGRGTAAASHEHGDRQSGLRSAGHRQRGVEADLVRPASPEQQPAAGVPAAARGADFAITDADAIGTGGDKTKFRNNLAAIRLLRRLDETQRPATRDEQATLAKWVGWGGLRNAFAREDGSVAKGWEKEAAELRELLTDAEYRAAEASTLNAHYTSPEVVRAIWSAVERLGFHGGRVLEPSVGAGNFIGLMPAGLREGATITGVELDHITGGIARHLYPGAGIHAPVGFQDFAVPDGHFDLAIGNPPFGSERLYDRQRRALNKFSIHNFFFAKSIEALRPGGMLAMVVSNYFLDAKSPAARSYIADRADLVGAIRLPNNAFLANAGTEVTTDIVFLRKRKEGEPAGDRSWTEIGTWTDKQGRKVPLSRYFVANPERMLGEFGAYGEMYREGSPALIAREGQDLAGALDAAVRSLPENLIEATTPATPEAVTVATGAETADIGSMFLAGDGTVHRRLPDMLGETRSEPVKLGKTTQERITGMIRVRDAFARLRRAQIDPAATDEQLRNLRARLNKVYDTFVGRNGPLNLAANKRLFRDDPTWPQISALEDDFEKGLSPEMSQRTGESAREPSAKKAAIFSRRTQHPYRRPDKAASAKDALSIVLADLGRIDLPAMTRLYGRSEEAIVEELGSLLYRTPDGRYETADAYLSGNVKQKLAEAERAAERDPAFRRNVDALREVIPADIEAVDIAVKPGSSWVPPADVAAFADHITGAAGAKAVYSPFSAAWEIIAPRSSEAADTQWATSRIGVAGVLNAAFNGKAITIFDRQSDGSSVRNDRETDLANEKAERVKAEWQRWLWEDDARRERLARLYNDTFNTDVERAYDGSHLALPGKVGDDIIALRPHQKNFVWRALQSSTVLADHTVGAGKTFAAIAAVMEMRRTGQARKPMVVVPNHLVGQWGADFTRLYPGARILAATKRDFEAENRKRLFARIATGDWDAVVVAHSSFGRIGVAPAVQIRFIEGQIADIEASLAGLRAETGQKSRSVSDLNKQRARLRERIKTLLDSGSKDEGLTFDELGVDGLVVDEAHEFKNLAFSTSMQRVAGLGASSGSQKASDLYMKVQHVKGMTGGRNIVFLTGTPISNTMAEMFTMQRYLDEKALRDLGLSHFDAWARAFGDIVTDWELSPTGQYKLKSRFSKFVNVPELLQRYRSFADVITNDDIAAMLAREGKRLPVPKVKGGRPTNVVVERSQAQARYVGVPDEKGHYPRGSLVWRAENLPKPPLKQGDDNMLSIMSDARKAALDMRLVDPGHGDHAGSKLHEAADRIKAIYDRWSPQKGTQLVFIDLSTPAKARQKEAARIRDLVRRAEEGDEEAQAKLDDMNPDEFLALDGKFSAYDDLKTKLIARGLPAAEIAFIHDANTEAQKDELFGKVRSGRVRVLFGSTPKMGAGTNVQNRLVALHHLDAPWRPSDLEQRDGRGVRQGNELFEADPDGFEIEILRYATGNTLDARQWQTIETKARFIGQLRKGLTGDREIEDISGEAANAAEMKAAASGNPLILEEMDLRQRMRRLGNARESHAREQHRIRDGLRRLREEGSRIDERMAAAEADAASARKLAGKEFSATVGGQKFDKQSEFGAAIVAAGRRLLAEGGEASALGSVGDFRLSLEALRNEAVAVVVDGARRHEVAIDDIGIADPLGTARRVVNLVGRLAEAPAQMRQRAAEIGKELPALERQLGDFAQQAELDKVQARHREVIAKLRPKERQERHPPQESAAHAGATVPTLDAEGPEPGQGRTDRASVADGTGQPPGSEGAAEPVARLAGDELGVTFRGPEDMPALRRAAVRWYDENLRGTVTTMRDGRAVRFTRRGMGKTTSTGKGDILLRSIPAIRAIIERGHVVLTEPGSRPGILERLVIAAPVDLAGTTHHLAVSVHKAPDGHYQYDFTFDRDAGVPGQATRQTVGDIGGRQGETPRVARGGLAPADRPLPGLEVPRLAAGGAAADMLNLFEWTPSGKAAETLIAALRHGAAGRFIDRLVASGRVRIGTAAEFGAAPGVQAFTDPDGRITLLADRIAEGAATAVLLHEAFHAARDGLAGTRAWSALTRRLGGLYRQFEQSSGRARAFFDAARERVAGAENTTGAMSEALRIEEFGAYAVEHYEQAPGALKRWVDDAIGAVKAWALRRFGRQVGQVTPAELRALALAALRDGQVAAAPAAGGRATLATPAATRRHSVAGALTFERVAEELRGKLTDLKPHLLALVPLNYFPELKRPNMVAVDQYLHLKRQMDADRGKKHAAMNAVSQDWLRFAAVNRRQARDLADLMHEATIAGIDPAMAAAEGVDPVAHKALRQRFQALPPAGRELFTKVRDAYRRQAEELDAILVENFRKAMERAEAEAEKAYEAEKARIAGTRGMSKTERDMALADAERARAVARTRSGWARKARLTKLRQQFEASRVPAPYFPLGRFGNYFVTVRDVDGTVVSFSRFERAADRDRYIREHTASFQRDYPGARIEDGVLDVANDLKRAMDPRMVAEIEEILGRAGVDDAVLDAIWQRYLQTMPDLSIRKRFIHRHGRAGFEADALRVFSSHMFHAAHQMTRLKYGGDLKTLTDEAAEQARSSDDPTRGTFLANELRRRHEWVMNPTGSRAVQAVTSAMFVWYLGGTAAAAMVNLSQTPLLGIPVLGARLGGAAKASAALLRSSRDLIAGRGSVTRAKLSAEEKAAVEAFYESGLIERTQSHELAGVGVTGVEYSPLRHKVMSTIAWMFHQSEVVNREITALAAYRMARERGQTHDQAVDTAHELTWKTHFDYSNSSRARIMQGDPAKLIMVFQNFQFNMWYRVFRDIHQSLKGESPQARREARYQLAGIMGMMTLLSGVTGFFGYNALMAIAGLFFDDGEDPREFKAEFEGHILKLFGPDLGGIILKGAPGRLTGIELTNRIGMPDFFVRAPNQGVEGREWYKDMLIGLFGVVPQTVISTGDGIGLVTDGKLARGAELLVPKFIRDFLRAYRYADEGLATRRGDEILPRERFDAWDFAAQSIGWTPAKVSEAWERNSRLQGAAKAVLDERRELVNRWAMAMRLGDAEARGRALDAISRFNQKAYGRPVPITGETLRQSLATRARSAARRDQGDGALIQNPRLRQFLLDAEPARL